MKKITIIFLFFWSTNLSAQNYTFPLKIGRDKRHLTDQRDRPFLYFSDSGWLLFMGLTIPEAREYLLRRKAQGFSVVHVFLTPTPGKKNLKGQVPFVDFDFSKINEAYFEEAEKYIALADSLRMALAVVPLWYSCCNDGWASHPEKYFKKNGTEKLNGFGEYLGKRFGKYKNIVWIMGGDNDPHDNRAEVRALALGLKKSSPHQLITYHASSTHSSTDVWENETWLDFSMVYTYFRGFHKAWTYMQPDVYEVCYTEYLKQPIMPFVLGESTYEGEHDEMGSALQARKQAYWTMLSGGAGHSYGSPFWAVGSSEIRGKDWRKVIELEGANTLQHLNTLLSTFDWTKLVPVFPVQPEKGFAKNDYAVTAITTDKRILVSYIPSQRIMNLNLASLSSGEIDVKQFNPRTGAFTLVKTIPKKRDQSYTYSSPDSNDWVLLLEVK
jgi:hypothetical protein